MKLKMDEDTALILFRILDACSLSEEGVELITEDLNTLEIFQLHAQLKDKLIERGTGNLAYNTYLAMEGGLDE
jgi:hypothetical protein